MNPINNLSNCGATNCKRSCPNLNIAPDMNNQPNVLHIAHTILAVFGLIVSVGIAVIMIGIDDDCCCCCFNEDRFLIDNCDRRNCERQ